MCKEGEAINKVRARPHSNIIVTRQLLFLHALFHALALAPLPIGEEWRDERRQSRKRGKHPPPPRRHDARLLSHSVKRVLFYNRDADAGGRSYIPRGVQIQ
jgi:hypothetical protein